MMPETKRKLKYITGFGVGIAIILATLILCFSLLTSITSRMNESATSNLLNTTRVIRETLEGYVTTDLESLDAIGEFWESGDTYGKEKIQIFCDTLGFDWMVLIDNNGQSVDSFENQLDITTQSWYPEWVRGSKGYSQAFLTETGRLQIAMWVPINQDGNYIGTIFGAVILEKYYSANVFTFYDGEGRTYLFDGDNGSWILASLGTDGTQTQHDDIYSLLVDTGNSEDNIEIFRNAIEERKAGTVELMFNGQESFLCFLPMKSSSNWYIATVISRADLLRESFEVQTMISIVIAIIGTIIIIITLGLAFWFVRKTRMQEAKYRDMLFSNLSANLDSVFIIYENNRGNTPFVSDNVERLLGIDKIYLTEDISRIFDWCGIATDDEQRIQFLDGTLGSSHKREIELPNEFGDVKRAIRLELIPTDRKQLIAVLTDITKDKEIQHSLVEAMNRAEIASNAKNDFLSAMSHDLRTPINGIVGMTVIAAANIDDSNRVHSCLTKISESTNTLLVLIDEVLDMAQMEKGKFKFVTEPFNIAQLLQDLSNQHHTAIADGKHNFNIHIRNMEHEEVIGDSSRLTRIINNLISNAFKYTPEGGDITVTLCEKPQVLKGHGCYQLSVSDNGIGMSQQFLQKVFEPFEREEDVVTRRIQGTGLGMTIVKNIVELMHGKIDVASEKGKGTTFTVTINLKLGEHATQYDATFSGLPVLVVDDDIVECETVTDIINDIGMHGEWANNGETAIQMISARHQQEDDYFAVLLDWKMPGMDGLETARRIRSEIDPNVPVIILTAYDWVEIESEARSAGVNSFLTKPLYKTKLLRKMTEISEGQLDAIQVDLQQQMTFDNIPKDKRILLVEDNPLNMEIALEMLRMMGLNIDCAEDGARAVDMFAQSQVGTYDLILMDIQMPNMNGYEATSAIRAMSRADSKLPIIAMTADAYQKDEQSAIEAGMDEHFTKPISVERLVKLLVRHLSDKGGE